MSLGVVVRVMVGLVSMSGEVVGKVFVGEWCVVQVDGFSVGVGLAFGVL